MSNVVVEGYLNFLALAGELLCPGPFLSSLLRYLNEKEPKGGDVKSERYQKSIGQNDPLISTAKKIADQTGVSEKTIKRDAIIPNRKALSTFESCCPMSLKFLMPGLGNPATILFC